MSRHLCTLLIVLAAGCAGGDLMRTESDGDLGPAPSDGTTGGTEPATTSGMSGISAGPVDTTAPDDETTTGPSSDTDPTSPGDTDEASETGDADQIASSGADDDESSSSTGDAPVVEVDLSGWTIEQTNSVRTFTLPENTLVPAGGLVVVGRDASRAQFEAYWGLLGDDVVYFNAGDAFPAINGDETFTLLDDGGATIDGPTPAIAGGDTVRRNDLSAVGSWTVEAEGNANPGIGHPDPGAAGVFLTEASDASGSGNFVYEFVELQAWP